MTEKLSKIETPLHQLSDKQLRDLLDASFKIFRGQIDEWETAVGALMIGRYLGWRGLYLAHSHATMRKYEEILGVSFQKMLPEEGEHAHRSYGWKLWNAKRKFVDFWSASRGEEKGFRSREILDSNGRRVAT